MRAVNRSSTPPQPKTRSSTEKPFQGRRISWPHAKNNCSFFAEVLQRCWCEVKRMMNKSAIKVSRQPPRVPEVSTVGREETDMGRIGLGNFGLFCQLFCHFFCQFFFLSAPVSCFNAYKNNLGLIWCQGTQMNFIVWSNNAPDIWVRYNEVQWCMTRIQVYYIHRYVTYRYILEGSAARSQQRHLRSLGPFGHLRGHFQSSEVERFNLCTVSIIG